MLTIAIVAEFELAEKFIETLENSTLEIDAVSVVELYPFSQEQGLRFRNKSVAQYDLNKVDWSEFNYVFFAGFTSNLPQLVQAAESGCIVIDVHGLCTSLTDVPMMVPSISNDEDLIALRNRNIVSLPNIQTLQAIIAINPLLEYQIDNIVITSLMPASAKGSKGVKNLAGQTARLLNGIPLDPNQQRLAFDVYPLDNQQCLQQFKRFYPQLEHVVFHNIQTPIFYGLAQQVSLNGCITSDIDFAQQWADKTTIQYHSETLVTPVSNGEDESNQLHISNAKLTEQGIDFWLVADEQRLQSSMAVNLAERIYTQGY